MVIVSCCVGLARQARLVSAGSLSHHTPRQKCLPALASDCVDGRYVGQRPLAFLAQTESARRWFPVRRLDLCCRHVCGMVIFLVVVVGCCTLFPLANLRRTATSGLSGGQPDFFWVSGSTRQTDRYSSPQLRHGRHNHQRRCCTDSRYRRTANPQVVVIELGGHDFLTGGIQGTTKANLQKIIDATSDIGAEVVLVEIPRGFIIDPFNGLERELAQENDLQLAPDTAIRNLVLWSPFAPPGIWCDPATHYSNDGLHPNQQATNCWQTMWLRHLGGSLR